MELIGLLSNPYNKFVHDSCLMTSTHFQISGGLDLLITAFQTVICSLFCNVINLMLYFMIKLFFGNGLYPLGID